MHHLSPGPPSPLPADELCSLHDALVPIAEAAGAPKLLEVSTSAIASAEELLVWQRAVLAQGAQGLDAAHGPSEPAGQQQEHLHERPAAADAAAAQERAAPAQEHEAAQAASASKQEVQRAAHALLSERFAWEVASHEQRGQQAAECDVLLAKQKARRQALRAELEARRQALEAELEAERQAQEARHKAERHALEGQELAVRHKARLLLLDAEPDSQAARELIFSVLQRAPAAAVATSPTTALGRPPPPPPPPPPGAPAAAKLCMCSGCACAGVAA